MTVDDLSQALQVWTLTRLVHFFPLEIQKFVPGHAGITDRSILPVNPKKVFEKVC